MRVTRLAHAAELPLLRARRSCGSGPGSPSSPAATAPARRTCSRRSTSPAPAARAGPPTSARCVRFGARADAAGARGEDDAGPRTRSRVGFQPGEPKRLRVDGAPVERLTDSAARPLVSVFLPDRLELVLGAPALRRAHLDQVVAALWPARAGTRRAYAAALAPAQRADRRDPRRPRRPRLAAGVGRRARPPRHRADARPRRGRRAAARRASPSTPAALGLEGEAELALPAALEGRDRRGAGRRARRARRRRPRARLHRPRPAPRRPRASAATGRELRAYGSRGQQRLGLLALLLAEREELAAERGAAAADAARRRDERARRRPPRAARRACCARGGQSVITTTELAHVPGAEDAGVDARRDRRGRGAAGAPGEDGAELGRGGEAPRPAAGRPARSTR